MGVLTRFVEIINANINALLEKAEDPAKMVDQYLIDARNDLADVKKQTAEVMAEEARTKRLVDVNVADVAKYTDLAKKALQAGNEGDAKVFIAKKQQLENEGAPLQVAYAAAHENAVKMRQLHDKLTADIQQLEAKKAAIKAKVSVAETQQTVNKYTYSSDKFDQTVAAVQRMEDKANKMLDEATAMAELNAQPIDEAKVIEEKYKNGETASVNEELEALKKELGLVEE
ncbi:MAG: PspA/IM30 family protein [Firmicutes bacterium]|nr:PspA/IM30 family protein [Bacillota bacterium]MBR0442029.1 PspA/IM30 family protein [Bacillota bacterium]